MFAGKTGADSAALEMISVVFAKWNISNEVCPVEGAHKQVEILRNASESVNWRKHQIVILVEISAFDGGELQQKSFLLCLVLILILNALLF